MVNGVAKSWTRQKMMQKFKKICCEIVLNIGILPKPEKAQNEG